MEKYAGREIAIVCTKGFQIDMQRNSQSPFIIFNGQKAHDDTAVLNAQAYIEKNAHRFGASILTAQSAVVVAKKNCPPHPRFVCLSENVCFQIVRFDNRLKSLTNRFENCKEE